MVCCHESVLVTLYRSLNRLTERFAMPLGLLLQMTVVARTLLMTGKALRAIQPGGLTMTS